MTIFYLLFLLYNRIHKNHQRLLIKTDKFFAEKSRLNIKENSYTAFWNLRKNFIHHKTPEQFGCEKGDRKLKSVVFIPKIKKQRGVINFFLLVHSSAKWRKFFLDVGILLYLGSKRNSIFALLFEPIYLMTDLNNQIIYWTWSAET